MQSGKWREHFGIKAELKKKLRGFSLFYVGYKGKG